MGKFEVLVNVGLLCKILRGYSLFIRTAENNRGLEPQFVINDNGFPFQDRNDSSFQVRNGAYKVMKLGNYSISKECDYIFIRNC